jgi:ribosomal protein S18 acetylase RimI-like enzyme
VTIVQAGDIGAFSEGDIPAIIDLWNRAGLIRPWNDPGRDIEFARESSNADILICRAGETICATVMVGHDGHRGVVYYLAVAPDHQGKGLGKRMMAAAEDWLKRNGVWKLNLMIRADNSPVQTFYERIGYSAQDRIVMSRRLGGQKP